MKLLPNLIIFTLLFFPNLVFAQLWSGILDPTRAVDWTQAGIFSGGVYVGIPTNRTQCGSAITSTGSDQTSAINTALNSCGSGHYLLLAAGTFTVAGHITIPSNTTLRGSGASSTILQITGSGDSAISLGPCTNSSTCGGSGYNSGTHTAITSGASKSSSSFVVTSASGISVGSLIQISSNNTAYMSEVGTGGDCSWCPTNGSVAGQTVEVTAVNGTTITVRPPLYFDYQTAGSPQAYPYAVGGVSVGLESLQVYATNSGYQSNIDMVSTKYSWVKGVEGNFCDHDHIIMTYSLGDEVRDSFFHDAFTHTSGANTDTELKLGRKTSAALVENNIFWRQHTSVLAEWGPSGNVIAYNYFTGNYHDSQKTWQIEDNAMNHGAHPFFNLNEGNIEDHYQDDDYWGTSSHNTVFRSYGGGSRQYVPPANARGVLQTGSFQWEDSNIGGIILDSLAQYDNLVGDIAGSAHLMSLSPIGIQHTGAWSNACIRIGYNNNTNALSSPNNTYNTVFMHGVLDCIANTFIWDAGHPDHTLPASFIHTSKPAWFGSVPWPPIGPDVTGGTVDPHGYVNAIPAQLCFNSTTTNGTTNTGSFNPTTCYAASNPQAATPTFSIARNLHRNPKCRNQHDLGVGDLLEHDGSTSNEWNDGMRGWQQQIQQRTICWLNDAIRSGWRDRVI